MPTYKDINLLTQKSTVVGTEKLPVSDTEFITPDQIAGTVGVLVGNSPYDFAISDEDGYCIAAFRRGHIRTKNFDSEAALIQSDLHDFAIADDAGYRIAIFRRGHIRTKNFDSETVMAQIGDIATILASI